MTLIILLIKSKPLCFNPCFGGSYIVTSKFDGSNYGKPLFQSLFWWILYCDLFMLFLFFFIFLFQSLFWWILYCDFFNVIDRLKKYDSFNPCFGGSYIVTICNMIVIYHYMGFNPCFGGSYIVTQGCLPCYMVLSEFQSLFWWILYCDISLFCRFVLG